NLRFTRNVRRWNCFCGLLLCENIRRENKRSQYRDEGEAALSQIEDSSGSCHWAIRISARFWTAPVLLALFFRQSERGLPSEVSGRSLAPKAKAAEGQPQKTLIREGVFMVPMRGEIDVQACHEPRRHGTRNGLLAPALSSTRRRGRSRSGFRRS